MSVILNNFKVLTDKERLKDCVRLKETEEAEINAICDLGLDPFFRSLSRQLMESEHRFLDYAEKNILVYTGNMSDNNAILIKI